MISHQTTDSSKPADSLSTIHIIAMIGGSATVVAFLAVSIYVIAKKFKCHKKPKMAEVSSCNVSNNEDSSDNPYFEIQDAMSPKKLSKKADTLDGNCKKPADKNSSYDPYSFAVEADKEKVETLSDQLETDDSNVYAIINEIESTACAVSENDRMIADDEKAISNAPNTDEPETKNRVRKNTIENKQEEVAERKNSCDPNTDEPETKSRVRKNTIENKQEEVAERKIYSGAEVKGFENKSPTMDSELTRNVSLAADSDDSGLHSSLKSTSSCEDDGVYNSLKRR